MRAFIKQGVVLFALLWVAAGASGQTIQSLQEQIRQAEEEIRINTELLNKTRKDQQVNQSQLKLIQSRIRNREQIVRSLDQQMDLVGKDIDSMNMTIGNLNSDLEKIRKEYAELIYASYKNYKLNNFMVFLFASTDFNDAVRRIDFMRRYNRMRERKAEEINRLSEQIGTEVLQLDSARLALDKTRQARSSELALLGKDESQRESAVRQLKAQESKISKELSAKRAQVEKAQKRIQEIIAEEAKKARSQKRTTAEVEYDTELSGRFDQNMGRLPYPIRGGVIIDRYGVHAHPTQKGLVINNKGINIAGDAGAPVYCVFEGTVTRVFSLPGLNNCVMVRHGNYITVYSNLATVSVKSGAKVATNQQLGRIASSSNSDDNMLHFEIWKETTNLNPESWLRR